MHMFVAVAAPAPTRRRPGGLMIIYHLLYTIQYTTSYMRMLGVGGRDEAPQTPTSDYYIVYNI